MKVKLVKKFGLHEKGKSIEANEKLKKHLLAGGYIKVAAKKKAK